MSGIVFSQHRAANFLRHDYGPGLADEVGQFILVKVFQHHIAPVHGRDRAFLEGVGADLEQELLVDLVQLQDDAVVPVEREGFLADLKPGLAPVFIFPGAGQIEGYAAEVFEACDALASSCSPNTRAKMRSTFLKW